MTKTWEDYELSGRARQAIRNMGQTWSKEPEALIAALKKDYTPVIEDLLRIPNCGRGTVNEILEALGVAKPEVGPKLTRFKDETELLIHIADNELILDTADKATMLMIIRLMSEKAIEVYDGVVRATAEGDMKLEAIRDEEPAVMILKGKLRVLRDLIAYLPDKYGTQIDESAQYREFDNTKRIEIELDG